MGYPIVDLGTRPDVLGHLRRIEEVIIRAAADIGVTLGRDDEATGVWSGAGKVCAIGVKLIRARVTLHGFALNCATDLSWFDAIVPCGLAGRGVASLSQLASRSVTVEEMTPVVTARFEEVFAVRFDAVSRSLPIPVGSPGSTMPDLASTAPSGARTATPVP